MGVVSLKEAKFNTRDQETKTKKNIQKYPIKYRIYTNVFVPPTKRKGHIVFTVDGIRAMMVMMMMS